MREETRNSDRDAIRMHWMDEKKMAVTLEEIDRKVRQEIISSMTLEQRLAGVADEDVLNLMPPIEVAKALLRFQLQRDPSPDEIDALLNNLKRK